MDRTDCRVLLLVKAPLPGVAKTRLAAGIGLAHALGLYRACVLDLAEMLCETGYTVEVYGTPEVQVPVLSRWLDCAVRPQRGETLGERMEAAFHDAFDEGVERAVLVGSDLPLLSGEVLDGAFRKLESAEAVLAPAPDGGYSLVGLTPAGGRARPFAMGSWGAPNVLQRTLDRLRYAGVGFALLEPIPDLDTREDLERLAALPRERFAGERFPAKLARYGYLRNSREVTG